MTIKPSVNKSIYVQIFLFLQEMYKWFCYQCENKMNANFYSKYIHEFYSGRTQVEAGTLTVLVFSRMKQVDTRIGLP